MEKICFFSHNWNDGKDDFKRMLKDRIISLSDSQIKVIYDKDDFEIADNLDDKENIIYKATSVIVFLSPEYNQCVNDKNDDKGSYREYQKIINRLSHDKHFIIPVLVSGNHDKSVPEDLKKIIYQDATKYNAYFDEKIYNYKSNQDSNVDDLAYSIINITNLLYKIHSKDFLDSVDLINELIHNNHSMGTLPSKCMIITDAYKQIMREESFLFSGRKGSGKTTLKEIIEGYNPFEFAEKYKTLYPIHFDLMNLELVYNIYDEISVPNDKLFRYSDIVKIFWELFFIFSSILVVTREYECHKISDSIQKARIEPIFERIKELVGQSSLKMINTQTIFTLTYDSICNHYNRIKEKNYGNRNYKTILVSSLTADNIARNEIGSKLIDLFEAVVKRCKKRIMLFVDGFDSDAEQFSKTSKTLTAMNYESKTNRELFETEFYKGLINVVTQIKEKNRDNYFSNVHFCIILPEEIIQKVKMSDRDFIKKRVSVLRWDAVYLIKMINRRLLAIHEFDAHFESQFELFNAYLTNYYPQIPSKYIFKTQNKVFSIDLFDYMLSLSFWRPRDLLIHLAYILGAIESDTSENISQQTLRTLMFSSSEDIIENEFIKEYKNTVYNINEIINSFDGKNIILTPNECYSCINNITFILAAKQNLTNFKLKIRFLYEIGFLGVVLPNSLKEKYSIATNYCFIYNEGIKPFEIINLDNDISNIRFVINHLFYNYLNLNYNSDVFVENFSKDYYISNHQIRLLIRNI